MMGAGGEVLAQMKPVQAGIGGHSLPYEIGRH